MIINYFTFQNAACVLNELYGAAASKAICTWMEFKLQLLFFTQGRIKYNYRYLKL
jgi:hypothetical protein